LALPFLLEFRLVIMKSTVPGVSARALEEFAARAQRLAAVPGEADVLITSSANMRRLNRQFAGKDAATDVLSFPSNNRTIHHGGTETRRNSFSKPSVSPRLRGGFSTAGDLAISAEIATRNAHQLGHGTSDELKILILHGLLHLAGYDHESDSGAMARKEARLRRKLGLPVALIERTTPRRARICHRDTEARRRSFSKSSVSLCLGGGSSGKRRRS
jgi:probable rRNA maturation factor